MLFIRYIKFSIIFILLIPVIGIAHPHSFITLKTTFYTDNQTLTKLHFVWTLDEMTSSYLKFEYKQNPKTTCDDLMINIFENHFFSEFWLKSDSKTKPIILKPQQEDIALNLDTSKAVVSFWAKLKQPIELKNNQFELFTYEKTFYVDMYYQQDNDIQINNPDCTISLSKPTPDDSILNYAQSLDQDDSPVESEDFVLGKLFAQKVIVSCK